VRIFDDEAGNSAAVRPLQSRRFGDLGDPAAPAPAAHLLNYSRNALGTPKTELIIPWTAIDSAAS
jgi:hypothetical protein